MSNPIARNTLLAAALVCSLASQSYGAESAGPTLHQVFEAVQAGKLAEADAMMNEVLKTHPESAKAHFVHAEVLAREGRRDEAREALATAEKLSPGLTFVKPDAVSQLKALIAGSAPAVPLAEGRASAKASAIRPILLGVGGIFLVMFLVRAFAGRRAARAYPASPYGAPQGGAPGGYPGPMGPGPAAPGSGLGSGIATGLAMGAGLAAGEALVHRVMDGNRMDPLAGGAEPGGLSRASQNLPEDQDFGVSGGSWDDNPSGFVDGSDLGSGDIGGDDWS